VTLPISPMGSAFSMWPLPPGSSALRCPTGCPLLAFSGSPAALGSFVSSLTTMAARTHAGQVVPAIVPAPSERHDVVDLGARPLLADTAGGFFSEDLTTTVFPRTAVRAGPGARSPSCLWLMALAIAPDFGQRRATPLETRAGWAHP
jgi:hypothetical protein